MMTTVQRESDSGRQHNQRAAQHRTGRAIPLALPFAIAVECRPSGFPAWVTPILDKIEHPTFLAEFLLEGQ